MIILEDTSTLLQTIYLKGDGRAVKIDPTSGRIAVGFGREVLVLSPVLIYDQPLRWEVYCTIEHEDDVLALGWSSKDEIATGSRGLNLWNVVSQKVVWSKRLAQPVQQLEISPDSNLIATIGADDRLVKVWRRTSFDSQYTKFDFVYLSHPQPVHKVRWRSDKGSENTLYTFALDDQLRVWMPYDSFDGANLQLWGSVPIQYENAFVIDHQLIKKSVEQATQKHGEQAIPEAIKICQRNPDLCVTMDPNTSRVTVYSIEGVHEKHHKRLTNIFKLMEKQLSVDCTGIFNFIPYPPNHHKGVNEPDMSLIGHDMNKGVLYQYTLSVAKIFDRKVKSAWSLQTILTGHNKSVRSISRGNDGESLLSKSRFDENYVWKPKALSSSITLKRTSLIQGKIMEAALVAGGKFVVTLLDGTFELVLWDCRVSNARPIAKLSTNERKIPESFFLSPENIGAKSYHHVVAVYSYENIRVWRIRLPTGRNHDNKKDLIFDMGTFGIEVDEGEELEIAEPVDPVGWSAKISEDFFDLYQRDVLATISTAGTIRTWTAQIRDDEYSGMVEWLETGKVETGIQKISRAQVSSTRKVATTNSEATKLCIWDTRNRLLEFEETFDDTISDLDWTSAPDGQSVLGVGFASRQVMLYCQLRFDYTNDISAWAPFKRVDISCYTSHPIGDSIWLKDGGFVVGAGNQFFIQDNKIDPDTGIMLDSRLEPSTGFVKGTTIFDVCAVLNGPLPMYHPQLLIQSIFAGKIDVVKKILVSLLKQLKFSPEVTSNVDLPDVFFDNDQDKIGINGFDKRQKLFRRNSYADHNDEFNESLCEQLGEWIQRVSLPYLTRHQQITLASVIEALAQTDVHRRSLDENGIRFLVGFKLFKVHPQQTSMTIRDFNWALHSESQDILLQLIERSSGNTPMLWPSMREVGYAYWLRDEKLQEQFEILGRNYFNHDGKRDPIACTLYYLALRKKQILIGLWRTASWHREQTKTIKLLSNDFTQPRWRSAALKNAFALLGKHRYEYAASFFLLGDSLRDAVNVLIKNVGDMSLAIAVARVYETDPEKPVLKSILQNQVLPQAERTGDRWTISWAYWLLGEQSNAIQSLAFGQGHQQSETGAKLFLVDDPVLVVLYRYLRDQSLKTTNSGGRGNYEGLNVTHEFDFISKAASIYSRMGCDVLGLDLVKKWQFVRQEKEQPQEPIQPPLKRRPTLVQSDSTLSKESVIGNEYPHPDHGIMKDLKPVSAQAFQEPDMSAFDFGF